MHHAAQIALEDLDDHGPRPKALPVAAKLAPETRQLIGILQVRPQHQATSLSETDDARLDNAALRDATLSVGRDAS